jgi:putative transposase
MPSHVHLLVTPAVEGGVSKMMQYLGRHYVQYINKTYRRTGTLWERRYCASVVESEAYLLTLYRYIELNPVRRGMVQAPEQYPWSSAKDHLAGMQSRLILDHESYTGLGDSIEARTRSYASLMRQPLEQAALAQIRAAARQGGVLGSDHFKERIETQLGRRVRPARRGRKPKALPQIPLNPPARLRSRPLVFALLSLVPALLQPESAEQQPLGETASDAAI